MAYLAAFVIALAASLWLTRTVRELAKERGLVDRPDAARKLHERAVPRVGGLAIYFSVFVSIGTLCLLRTEVSHYLRENIVTCLTMMGLGFLMMLFGLHDDLKNLSPRAKLLSQTLVALLSWVLGFQILAGWAHSGTILHLGLLSLPLTLFWIVGVTNAFNLIDGMDGLAAGAALFAMVTMLVLSISNGLQVSTVILAALAGATLGFLRYNFNPASIFLGDSGSQLLGFMLALIALKTSEKSVAAFTIAVPIVAFGFPVLDTAMAIIRRFLSGRPIFSADRGHIHHLLIERGLRPRNVVILLYGVCGAFGLFSLLFMNPSGRTVGFALAILGVCVWFGIQQMHYPELRGLNTHLSQGFHNQRKLIAGSVVVERMIAGIRHAPGFEELLQGLSNAFEELSFSRFELRLPVGRDGLKIHPVKGWAVLTDGPGRLLLQWTSPCVTCWTSYSLTHRSDESAKAQNVRSISNGYRRRNGRHATLPCDDCKEMKYSLLRKGLLAADRYGPADVKLEFEIRLSTSNGSPQNTVGSDVGFITFYHPAYCVFPVSTVSVLGQPVSIEMEKSLQRLIENNGQVIEPLPVQINLPIHQRTRP